MIEIKSRYTGGVLYTAKDAKDVRTAVEGAVEKAKTALTSAEWTVERREADLEALKNRGAIEIKAADTAPTSSTTAPITNYREETEG